MNRQILCPVCAGNHKMHPLDVESGWVERRVVLRAKRPVNHGYSVNNKFVALDELKCDLCGTAIHNGQTCTAITMWKASGYRSEPEPRNWEYEFTKTN